MGKQAEVVVCFVVVCLFVCFFGGRGVDRTLALLIIKTNVEKQSDFFF